jgi:hypothetical protein
LAGARIAEGGRPWSLSNSEIDGQINHNLAKRQSYALSDTQRFLVAAIIAFLPAAEGFRFGLGAASGADGSAAFLEAAHLFRCASAIAFLPAALIFRRFRLGGSDVAAVGSAGPPGSMARSSAILASIRLFWNSKPSMAAVMISFVSFGVGMLAFRNHSR